LADLADEAWILPPPDTFPGSATADLFRESGLNVPRAPLMTLSLHLCSRLTATGRFVTLLPSSVAQFGGRDLSSEGASAKASTDVGRVGRNRNAEEPHAEPGRADLHRMRSRIREVHGKRAAGRKS
jgi:DNA-binding transcriptional LysR family regulator